MHDIHSETILEADGFIKSRDKCVAFYTSDEEKFRLSELFAVPNPVRALRGWVPSIGTVCSNRKPSGFYHLHQNLTCNILIQLCLHAMHPKGLNRLFQHDFLLRHLQAVLAAQLLRNFLRGHCAE